MRPLKNIILSTLFLSICFAHNIQAQDSTINIEKKKPGQFFIDKDGDGYNDNAPDHDGDGIPNGLDPDWQKLQKEKNKIKKRFVDLDGDGINDNLQTEDQQEEMILQSDQKRSQMDRQGSSMESMQQKQKGNMQKQKGKKP